MSVEPKCACCGGAESPLFLLTSDLVWLCEACLGRMRMDFAHYAAWKHVAPKATALLYDDVNGQFVTARPQPHRDETLH